MYFCGMDIGSTAIKVLLIDEGEAVVAQSISLTKGRFYENAAGALSSLLAEKGMERGDIRAIVSTGYGRKLFREADDSVSEITANAAGAARFGDGGERIGTIINIGGQDSKVISLDERGRVGGFVMNDKCAAGTGRFLEMAARILDLDLGGLGECHLRATGMPAVINSTCTVFAESEIISLLAEGHGREEVIAGIHHSIARRIARLARKVEIRGRVLFDGGPALNRGLAAAIQHELMCPLIVPPAPQMTTALGAALIARRFDEGT